MLDNFPLGDEIRVAAANSADLTLIDPKAPFDTARTFLGRHFLDTAGQTLHHHRGVFFH